jgi:hypothetical protein
MSKRSSFLTFHLNFRILRGIRPHGLLAGGTAARVGTRQPGRRHRRRGRCRGGGVAGRPSHRLDGLQRRARRRTAATALGTGEARPGSGGRGDGGEGSDRGEQRTIQQGLKQHTNARAQRLHEVEIWQCTVKSMELEVFFVDK